MSAAATFTLIPVSALDQLKDASTSERVLFGRTKDTYLEFKKKVGKEVAQYPWSGYVFIVLLTYLQERGINLLHSSLDELMNFLSNQRGCSAIALTNEHRGLHLSKLEPNNFDGEALRDYYNAFEEADEPEAGRGMLEGIRALHEALKAVEASTFVLLEIG